MDAVSIKTRTMNYENNTFSIISSARTLTRVILAGNVIALHHHPTESFSKKWLSNINNNTNNL